MKRKSVVCLVTLIMLFALFLSVVMADEAKTKKSSLEAGSDVAICGFFTLGTTAVTKSPVAGVIAAGICTAVVHDKEKTTSTARKIFNKVNEAVGKFGESEAKKDKANPYRNKL